MKIICLECNRELGEKAPFDDHRATHTICAECVAKRCNRPGKGGLRRKIRRKTADG
jgi:hypothetical protein